MADDTKKGVANARMADILPPSSNIFLYFVATVAMNSMFSLVMANFSRALEVSVSRFEIMYFLAKSRISKSS